MPEFFALPLEVGYMMLAVASGVNHLCHAERSWISRAIDPRETSQARIPCTLTEAVESTAVEIRHLLPCRDQTL